MNRRFTAACTIVVVFAAPAAVAQTDQADVEATIEAWAAAFNECSAEKLAALYDPAATLWGTNSAALTTTAEGVRFYFNGACALQPPVKVSLGEHTTRTFGASATSAGAYTFVREGRNLPSRFSFALLKKDGKWLIVQHHSSAMPGRP